MTDIFFSVTMFICTIPTIWILFFYLYPKNWKERKMLLGVNNRKEFQEGEAVETVDAIMKKAGKQGLIISMAATAFGIFMLIFRNIPMQTFIWCNFLLIMLVVISVPYVLGRKELMSVKRSLGIQPEKGVSYVDLKTAGSVHALKMGRVILPNLLGLAATIFAVLVDLGTISVATFRSQGSFLLTVMAATFAGIGLVMTLIGFMMDGLKNEVISEDSDVNTNYNRAKKKNMADLFIGYLWVNTLYLIGMIVTTMLNIGNMAMMICIAVYMLLIMAGTAFFVRTGRKIDERYHKETTLITDDDEYWIGGMFYNNPADHRAMVEKRMGIGATINLGHPVGKAVGVLTALLLVYTFMMLIWVGMVEVTPIDLRLQDGKVICHQMRDEYVIPTDQIKDVQWGDDLSGLQMTRTNGVGMPNLLKGKFTVDNRTDCIVFLDPRENVYIRLETADGRVYYVSGADAASTRDIYEKIER